MATTRLMALHAGAGSIESALKRSTGYIENADKTNGGELVMSYECDPLNAPQEFMLSKREYALKTGRNQGRNNVIAYHLRQSFKPGEIDLGTAGRVAYETAMSLTKGRHSFVIAVHNDKAHIHSHTVFNSTSLDCSKKFRDFKRSGLALQKISDTVCLTNGLPVIENPKERGKTYDKWLGNNKPLGNREQLAFAIDNVLPKCKSWDDLISGLKSLGCEVKSGANISIKLPDAKKFIRLNSMPGGYDKNSLCARMSGSLKFEPKPLRETGAKPPQLLIDIQAKMKDGYGKGFEQWAAVENLKRSAKTLLYIQGSHIDSFDELEKKCAGACDDVTALKKQIRELEDRQKSINELQKEIGAFGKTRGIHFKWKSIKNAKEAQSFYEANRADIELCRSAKGYFDRQGFKGKLPSINALKAEWAQLEKQRRPLYAEYKGANQKFKELCTAKSNAARMLGRVQNRQKSRASDIEI